jgi:hypothetical protein
VEDAVSHHDAHAGPHGDDHWGASDVVREVVAPFVRRLG